MTLAKFAQKLALASSIMLAVVSQQASAITINLDLTGVASPTQQAAFTLAENYWETVLIGYQDGITIDGGVNIEANVSPIDGVGNILGSAGPTNPLAFQNDYYLTKQGIMNFDSEDLGYLETNGFLYDVILHEMAHVLGFGTLWELNGVYDPGTGQYTGTNALSTYQTEFNQPDATFVPVELGGGAGTAGGHWNEVDNGSGLTGITDVNDNDLRNELMTGWLNSPTFVSNTTKMSFMDIGYEVAVVPVPAALWLFISGVGLLLGFSRRKKTAY